MLNGISCDSRFVIQGQSRLQLQCSEQGRDSTALQSKMEAEAVGPFGLPRQPCSAGNSGDGPDPAGPLNTDWVGSGWVPLGDPEEPSRMHPGKERKKTDRWEGRK